MTYSVGTAHLTFDYTDYLLDPPGRTFTANMPVYYPTSLANGDPLPSGAAFPVMVFMQGGGCDQSRYPYMANIAAAGYIVALPNAMNAPVRPEMMRSVQIATTELLDRAIKELKRAAADPSSPFGSLIDLRIAIGGHSQGTIPVFASIATSEPGRNAAMPPGYQPDPAIKAAYMLGGALLNAVFSPGKRTVVLPDQPQITITNDIPLFMIAGEFDGLGTTNPDSTRLTMRRLGSLTSKRMWILPGGNHFGFCDGPREGDATAPQDLPPTISVVEQNDLVVKSVVAFLDSTLKGDEAATATLDRLYTSDY